MTSRINNALADMQVDAGNCLFVTLTAHYIKTEKGITESWSKSRDRLSKFLRRIRAIGFKTYVYVREAHEDGGCHIHIIMKRKTTFRTFAHNGKIRLDDEKLKAQIEEAWDGGHVDIQGIDDSGAGAYLTKEIGKSSHIENSLQRAVSDTETATAADKKKLWALYMCIKLKMRRWGVSRDLIKHMTNPTDDEEDKAEEFIIIPKKIIFSVHFQPYTQQVEKGTWLFKELFEIFQRRKGIYINDDEGDEHGRH